MKSYITENDIVGVGATCIVYRFFSFGYLSALTLPKPILKPQVTPDVEFHKQNIVLSLLICVPCQFASVNRVCKLRLR